jgi:hypothetical protein
MNIQDLIKKIDLFYKSASLVGNMANRIMFELSKSKGNFNIPAAKIAADGAEDLIFYGFKSIVGEMEHCKRQNLSSNIKDDIYYPIVALTFN